MTEAIEALLSEARRARTEGRASDARDAYARAADLGRESGEPVLQAYALRHLSDLECHAGEPEQALAHADQAAALYATTGGVGSLDRANSLRLRALALDALRRPDQARAAWSEARDLYDALEIAAGVADCQARLERADGS